MAISVVASDSRIGGRTPVAFPSFTSMQVDESTPLDYFIYRCTSLADLHGGISTLFLLTKAVDEFYAGESETRDGIVFCHESVDPGNAKRFSALQGKVGHIVVIVCAPLPTPFDVYINETVPAEMLQEYRQDGDELARQLGIHTGAKVIVAREPRHLSAEAFCNTLVSYEISGEGELTDFSDWDGTLTRYDPTDRSTIEQSNTGGYADAFGTLADPRSEQMP